VRIKLFSALPPYLGGKRRLVGEIFRHVPPPTQAPAFADAFLGGGSVSLVAEARGYRVLSNDCATRSTIVGKALIENDSTRLADEDVLRLFAPNVNAGHFVEKTFAPDRFTPNCARFLDLALANAGEMHGAKQSLALLLAAKYAFRSRPHGSFGARSIVAQVAEGRWEEVNANYARESINRKLNGHPLRAARAIAAEINDGVFSNGHRNEVHQLDAAEFLRRTVCDIAYLDPPYDGTASYESALQVLDSVLAGKEVCNPRSAFSSRDAAAAMDDLLDSARRIPLLVISYGNATVSLDEFSSMVGRHRPVQTAREIQYTHCSGLATAESKARNREFLVVAGRA